MIQRGFSKHPRMTKEHGQGVLSVNIQHRPIKGKKIERTTGTKGERTKESRTEIPTIRMNLHYPPIGQSIEL